MKNQQNIIQAQQIIYQSPQKVIQYTQFSPNKIPQNRITSPVKHKVQHKSLTKISQGKSPIQIRSRKSARSTSKLAQNNSQINRSQNLNIYQLQQQQQQQPYIAPQQLQQVYQVSNNGSPLKQIPYYQQNSSISQSPSISQSSSQVQQQTYNNKLHKPRQQIIRSPLKLQLVSQPPISMQLSPPKQLKNQYQQPLTQQQQQMQQIQITRNVSPPQQFTAKKQRNSGNDITPYKVYRKQQQENKQFGIMPITQFQNSNNKNQINSHNSNHPRSSSNNSSVNTSQYDKQKTLQYLQQQMQKQINNKQITSNSNINSSNNIDKLDEKSIVQEQINLNIQNLLNNSPNKSYQKKQAVNPIQMNKLSSYQDQELQNNLYSKNIVQQTSSQADSPFITTPNSEILLEEKQNNSHNIYQNNTIKNNTQNQNHQISQNESINQKQNSSSIQKQQIQEIILQSPKISKNINSDDSKELKQKMEHIKQQEQYFKEQIQKNKELEEKLNSIIKRSNLIIDNYFKNHGNNNNQNHSTQFQQSQPNQNINNNTSYLQYTLQSNRQKSSHQSSSDYNYLLSSQTPQKLTMDIIEQNKVKNQIENLNLTNNTANQEYSQQQHQQLQKLNLGSTVQSINTQQFEETQPMLVYQGEKNNQGEKHGYGILINNNHNLGAGNSQQEIYRGDWKNNQFHGQGKLVNQKKNNLLDKSFEIDFQDLSRLVYSFIDYEGDFKNNLFDGFGTLNLSNEDKFIGNFKNGQIYGQGTLYKNNSEEDRIIGVWEKNILVQQI